MYSGSFYKYMSPNRQQKLHLGKSNQHKSPGGFEKPAKPVLLLVVCKMKPGDYY